MQTLSSARSASRANRANRILVWTGVAIAVSLALASGLKAETLADPTRPSAYRGSVPTATTTAPGRMRVEAVVNRGGERLAIVDGKIVRAGDQVSHGRIEEVMSDGVRYTRGGVLHISRIESLKLRVRRESVTQVARKDTP